MYLYFISFQETCYGAAAMRGGKQHATAYESFETGVWYYAGRVFEALLIHRIRPGLGACRFAVRLKTAVLLRRGGEADTPETLSFNATNEVQESDRKREPT